MHCVRRLLTLQVSEAEAMAEGGIHDILLSNQVVAPRKLQRLVALAASGGEMRMDA